MPLHSPIINKNTGSQRNMWLFAILLGIGIGCCSAGVGFFFVKIPVKTKFIFTLSSIIFGAITGILIGFFGREILRRVVRHVSNDFVTNIGLKKNALESDKTGVNRELDIFEQVFRTILSVLKKVLLISFKLEETSIDLDRTAQISSQVIKEIVEGVGGVNKKADNNATNLRETISSLESSFSLSKDISSKLIIAKEDSQSVSKIASNTQISVKSAVEKMLKIKELTDGSASLVSHLNDRSKQIGTILVEIANIAEKTNLLALNAAIEAARAGEQGRGFAVVAEEVRKLARGSAESSKKINNLINDILQKTENAADMMQNNTTQVNEGMQVISDVEEGLGNMVQTSNQLNEIIKNISTSAESQSETSDVMYQKVNTISQITDEISIQIQGIANTALGKTVIIDQTSSSAKELRMLSDIFQNALVPFDFHIEGTNKRSTIRTETRVPCKFKILLSGELLDGSGNNDFQMRGVITNLSAGGCVVETTEDVEQGKYIVLSFQIGSNFVQAIQGRLVRIKTSEKNNANEDFMINQKSTNECIVSFNNTSSEHENIIIDFVMNTQRQFEINIGIKE